jgi:hypothetical protein
VSTADASVIRDFYNIDSRADPNAVEDLLSDIEGDAAAVFQKVLLARSWPLNANERAILATFLALQRKRTPSHRQMVEEIREVTTRALKSGGSDDALIPVKLDETDPKTVHIQSMLNIEEHAPYYFGRRWQLVRFSRKRLLTSDAPVGLLPSPDASICRPWHRLSGDHPLSDVACRWAHDGRPRERRSTRRCRARAD